MKLLIPSPIAEQITDALKKAGAREIGGILMGEHVGPDTFRLLKITVQLNGGTFASFVRAVSSFLRPLMNFFETTQRRYEKFNYLGEWHSHHSFKLIPSIPDHHAMFEIIQDPNVGAIFAVLLLVKLDECGLESSATVYRHNYAPYFGEVIIESMR